jgi:hypothetical protein
MAVAFEKRNAGTAAMWQKIHAKALADWRGNETQRPDFAWKVLDGDAPAHAGKEGWAGCMVLRLTSGFPPRCYDSGNPPQPLDPAQIKTGYYVRCNVGVRGNGSLQTPGMYLNLDMVQLCGYGAEISSGPDAAGIFGQAAPLPAGASAMPPAPAGAPPQASPGYPAFAPPQASPAYPAPGQTLPADHPAAGYPAPPQAPAVAPPMPAAPTMAPQPGAAPSGPDWGFLTPGAPQ